MAVTGVSAQTTAPARKKLLAIGEEKGYRHEAVSHALATIERLGRESGLWDTTIRTDTEALTKKKLEYNAPNLNSFDAVLFYTGGTLEMDGQQKAGFLSFIHDDGKGFIGAHSATITFTNWPEYGEMIGGYFDEHPWGTFNAPIIVEDPAFPGMGQWPLRSCCATKSIRCAIIRATNCASSSAWMPISWISPTKTSIAPTAISP